MRPEWATAHFEFSVATGSLWQCVATRLDGQAHDPIRASAIGLIARLESAGDRDSRSRVKTELSCRDRVWGWDGLTWVATEVFSIATESFWFCVVTMDSVATGCGQGREALCRDT